MRSPSRLPVPLPAAPRSARGPGPADADARIGRVRFEDLERKPALRRRSGLTGLCLLLALAGCRTQKYPGPMEPLVAPLPRGDLPKFAPGPEEVLVYRHANPVLVRPAENRNAYPLTFYNKQARLLSGGWLIVGPGGRGEVLWPDTGSSVMLYDSTAAVVGEPTRGEPTLDLRYVKRARLDLARDAVVRLPGGALFHGEPTEHVVSGPYHLEMIRESVLRVRNKSRVSATVKYRDEEILLGPDDIVDLVVLDSGTEPRDPWPGAIEFVAGPMVARVLGDVEQVPSDFGLSLVARESSEVSALGVHLNLTAGDRVQFLGLGDVSPEVTWATPLELGPPYTEPSASIAGRPLFGTDPPSEPLPPGTPTTPGPPGLEPAKPGMAGEDPTVPR